MSWMFQALLLLLRGMGGISALPARGTAPNALMWGATAWALAIGGGLGIGAACFFGDFFEGGGAVWKALVIPLVAMGILGLVGCGVGKFRVTEAFYCAALPTAILCLGLLGTGIGFRPEEDPMGQLIQMGVAVLVSIPWAAIALHNAWVGTLGVRPWVAMAVAGPAVLLGLGLGLWVWMELVKEALVWDPMQFA